MFVTLSNMIPTSISVFVVVVALFIVPSLQNSTPINPVFIDNMCLSKISGTYTNGSTYQHNLLTVLSSLETNSSSSSFYETSAAGTKDPVYGRYYCRHDLPLSTCTTCVQAATKQVVTNCSPAKEAIIWYLQCTLLYLNSSSRVADFDTWLPAVKLYDARSNVTDPEKLYPVLMSAMDRIINESAYGTGSEGFATAEAELSPWQKLYSLAQCSWDLEGFLCERCLRRALHEVVLCCKESVANMYFFSNCQIRYVVGAPFYDVRYSPPLLPPSPSSVISQESSPPGNREDARSSGNTFKTGVVIAAFTTLMFLNN